MMNSRVHPPPCRRPHCPRRSLHFDPSRLALAFVFLLLGAIRADTPPARPNILFLFSDDQRFDTIAALGNSHIHTPHLDRLTREGLTFTRAYIMGGTQGAVCMPSRAMLMSGRTLFRVKDNLAGQTTWPERFGEAGYATFMTGKWHNGDESLLRSFATGKAIFLGGMGDPYKLALKDISPNHQLVNPRLSGEHSVKLFADAAVEFLSRQKGEQPFLCYVAFNCPHDPRVPPRDYRAWYDTNQPPLPANFLPEHPFNNGEMTLRDEQLAPWPRTPAIVRQHLADYYAYITFLDDQIGRILDALKASGQYERTIIVFSSDNGLAIGSHGLFGKQNVYEHATHEPLIFAGPGIPRGQRSAAFCYLLDVFPTLGELGGVAALEGSEGRSLAPVIAGRSDHLRDTIFTAYRGLHRAVRDDRWKLIVYTQINKTQLFDLTSDPDERFDLAADAQYAGEVKRLTAILRTSQAEFGDRLPLTTEHPQPLAFDFSKVKRTQSATPAE